MLSDDLPVVKEYAKGEGHGLVQVFRNGKEVARREVRNLVVQNGKAFLANRALSSTPAPMNFMQLGKSPTAATSTQTNILTPIAATTLPGRQTCGTAAMSGTRTAKWEHTWTATEFTASGLEEGRSFQPTRLPAREP
jgi:hypothetical protein